ncbi:class F sortase [Nonomuraea typhae]|uniref:Class F sortase n=1 Tax=Nonomuraea typhae TaxID=2603600 RepID=A0ABW7Z6J2_9ACTN
MSEFELGGLLPKSRALRGAALPALAALLGAAALAGLSWARPGLWARPAPPPSAAPAVSVPAPSVTPSRKVGASPPVRVDIDKAGIHAEVMKLGLNPDRTLEVPPLSKADQAGWFELGAAPGTAGPAVIVGHVDTADGPAVFYRLGDLRPGDLVRVTRADRKVATFRLDAVETVPKDDFPTTRVYGETGFPALRLITCGGGFDRAGGHYTHNTIAYGHLISIS